MIQAVIFDLDGTLLNTLTDLVNSCNHALTELGFPTHTEEKFKEFIGHGRDFLLTSALGENYTQERLQQALALQDAYYKAHSQDFTLPYDGMVDLVKKLEANDILCAVVSNKPHDFCEILIPKFFGKAFNPIYGNIAGIPVKPDPYLIFKVLEEMGVAPENAVYVGDSDVDMITAKHSRVTGCGVSWGFRSKDDLIGNGADFLCINAKDLEDAIFVNQNEYIYELNGMKICAVRGQDEMIYAEVMGKSTDAYYEEFAGTNLYAIKKEEKLIGFLEMNPVKEEEISWMFLDEEMEKEHLIDTQEMVEDFWDHMVR